MIQSLERPEQHFVFYGVSWDYYDHTLRQMQDQHLHARVTFDQGDMEIMTLGDKHERLKKAIARLLETYALEVDRPITGLGSVTCRRIDLLKGLEPDECYYVATEPPPVGEGDGPLDLNVYPPPDLAIEVDITSVSIGRQTIYAALGIREIWRHDGAVLRPMKLTANATYQEMESSQLFPALSMPEFNRCIQVSLTVSQHAGVKAIRDWAREHR